MPADPTIPELVARLRELHEKATPGPWSTNHRGGDISARIRGNEVQVALACGQGAMWDERDDAAAIMRANAELIAELRSALPAILDALDHIGDANKMAAHSPDGGKVLDCDHCGTPCIPTCVACGETYSTTAEAAACEDAGFRSPRAPGAWRPISEPPSAEVHAWCAGFFLFRHVNGGLTWQRRTVAAWRGAAMARNGWKEWLPIPPSDERRG